MKYLFALFLALGSFASAFGTSRDSSVTTVPFDFVVGGKAFPAGTYTISRISDDPQEGLSIQSKDGKTSAFFHVMTAEAVGDTDRASLKFRHEGDRYFLIQVVGGSDIYTLPPASNFRETLHPDETVVTPGP